MAEERQSRGRGETVPLPEWQRRDSHVTNSEEESTCGDQDAGNCSLSHPQAADALDSPAVRICSEAAQNHQRLLSNAHTLEESLEAPHTQLSST